MLTINGYDMRVCTGNCGCRMEPKPYGPITIDESRERDRFERFHNLYTYLMGPSRESQEKIPNGLRKSRQHKGKPTQVWNNNRKQSETNSKLEQQCNSLVRREGRPPQNQYRYPSLYVREPSLLGIRAGSRLLLIKDKTAERSPRLYIKPPVLMDLPVREHLHRSDELVRPFRQPSFRLCNFFRQGTAAMRKLLTAANVNIEVVLIRCIMAELAAWAATQGL